MIDKEAIEALNIGTSEAIEQASRALIVDGKADHLAALPSHFTVHDLEKYLPNRRRARGSMSTPNCDDFASYVVEHKQAGASAFIDQQQMRAVAVLNLGNPGSPGHADNLATFAPEETAAYIELLKISNNGHFNQAKVAEFFEDFGECMQFFGGQDANEKMSTALAVSAIRKITIESLKKIESEEQSLRATRGTFESIGAANAEKIPTRIHFKCEPYHGFKERDFVMRLSILTNGQAPAIGLRIVKAEQHQEEMAKELVEKVRSSIAAKAPADAISVLIGSYSAK